MITDRKHNTVGGLAADQLRAYVSRLRLLDAETDKIGNAKRDILREAKACGFCKKTIRRMVMRIHRGETAVPTDDHLLELYEAAVAD